MTRPLAKQGGPPGRKTRQQEIDGWLQGLDLPPEVVTAIRAADPRVQVLPAGAPGTFREMQALAAQDLYDYYKQARGVAKVQTFKAISELAKAEKGDDEAHSGERDPLIADVVSGVASLSPIRKREILSGEHERLQEEITAVEGALATMDAAVAI